MGGDKKKTRKRLDVILCELGIAASREQAKTYIMSGEVFVNGQREDKAGTAFPADASIEYRGEKLPYVSRGGYKLEKALQVFPIELQGRICLDIGASTGGFTDCMLKNGASKVYAVDVGYGQLSWKLRTDDRVVSMEKTNFRYLTPFSFQDEPSFASADVSFISLKKLFEPAFQFLSEEAEMVCLVKPQFEVGREKVGKKGVVRDRAIHEEVFRDICASAMETGFHVCGLDFSPIQGPEGNIEFLLYLRKGKGSHDNAFNLMESEEEIYSAVSAAVESAHRCFM